MINFNACCLVSLKDGWVFFLRHHSYKKIFIIDKEKENDSLDHISSHESPMLDEKKNQTGKDLMVTFLLSGMVPGGKYMLKELEF